MMALLTVRFHVYSGEPNIADSLDLINYGASGFTGLLVFGDLAVDELKDRVTNLAKTGDGTITIIGHSLGGLYAREIARMQSDNVRQVISLGSPFAINIC